MKTLVHLVKTHSRQDDEKEYWMHLMEELLQDQYKSRLF